LSIDVGGRRCYRHADVGSGRSGALGSEWGCSEGIESVRLFEKGQEHTCPKKNWFRAISQDGSTGVR
jgi:hypothetical protein